jgi:hypothetical protein
MTDHICLLASRIFLFLRLQKASPTARLLRPRALIKELKKFPGVDLVEVRDSRSQVQVRTRNGKLLIDVDDPTEKVHIACPLETMEDAASELVTRSPGA